MVFHRTDSSHENKKECSINLCFLFEIQGYEEMCMINHTFYKTKSLSAGIRKIPNNTIYIKNDDN